MTRSTTLARTTVLAAMIAGMIALSAPAFADAGGLPRGAVSARGVDFASPLSVAHLKRRMRRVALTICSPSGDAHLMDQSERQCYENAVNDGLAQIDGRAQQAMRDRAVKFADSRADTSATAKSN